MYIKWELCRTINILARLTRGVSTAEKDKIRCVFPGRTKPAGLNSPKKCWWAKEITPDLHVAGRLTERQMKYAAEAGFKSILSLYTYPDSEPRKTFGGDSLPNTEEARQIVEDVAGLEFVNLLDVNDQGTSVGAVQKLTRVLPSLPKPALLHCNRGYTITFVTLLFLANQTQQDPAFTPRITSTDFYDISAAMGLDFISDIQQRQVVSEITKEPIPDDPTRPNVEPSGWMDYWMAHPVYKSWFTSGQITPSHLPMLEQAGFKSVINLRPGSVLDGKPSQEEVNLLNIQDATGTYAIGDKGPRQSQARLEETRIDVNRPNYFISPNSPVNYESSNYAEFGDDVGYQESLEAEAFENSSLNYYHMPVDVPGPYGPYLSKHLDEILKIAEEGPVLIQCAIGKRAAYVSALATAIRYDKDLDWALRRIRELGFDITESKTPELYNTYVDYLVTKRKTKEEL